MIKLLLLFTCLLPGFVTQTPPTEKNIYGTYPDDFVWIDFPAVHTFKPITVTSFSEDFESMVIPLKRAGNLILVEAIIDSLQGNLILDTGAAGMVLNSIYFRQNRLSGSMVAGGVTGSTGTVSRTSLSQLQISDIFFHGVSADITDLGHIEKARNVKILGFFGLSLLSDFEVVLDLKNSVMELHRLDYYGNRSGNRQKQPAFDLEVPVRVSAGVMFIDAHISDRKLIFCLDTGAESNVLSSHLPNKVLNTVSIFRRSNLRGVGSQSVEVLYGVMSDFSLAGKRFPEMNAIITNLNAMSDAYDIRVDGMLGCDFFEKGIFCLNLKKKSLRISFYKEEKI